jgi:hypothetical protein
MSTTTPPLTDTQLAADFPAVAELVRECDDIAARDPNPNVAKLAFALSRYFRTQD